jgi:hypothetical protein
MTESEGSEEERPIATNELDDWEEVETESKATRSAVLTVRLSEQEMRQVRDAAKAAGASMGDIVRHALSEHLHGTEVASAVFLGWSTDAAVYPATVGFTTFGHGRQVEDDELQTSDASQ